MLGLLIFVVVVCRRWGLLVATSSGNGSGLTGQFFVGSVMGCELVVSPMGFER